jgi:hypothetical protein
MEFPKDKPVLIDRFEIQKKELYVFFGRSKNQDAPNQSFLFYTKTKDCKDWEFSPNFDKKETQVLEALLSSENQTDKEVLHKYIVGLYVEGKKGLTKEKDEELFSPLRDIYYGKSRLATLRKKIAHGVDETLGTHLEEKKIAKPIKKIEKAVSDKLFGKVNE